MKTINLKSAFVTATVIAFLSLSSASANAQWKSERDDKTFREKIEEKLERERRNKQADDRVAERNDRYERKDVKYNNGRFNKSNRYDRNDCCRNCNHDKRFDKKKHRKNNRKHH
jgi:Ni/Co efflux regulator RcnB